MKKGLLPLSMLVLVLLVAGAAPAFGGTICSGATRLGNLTNPGQADAYTFQAKAGQAAVISMSQEGGGVNPQLLLYNPSGTLASTADSGIYGEHASIDGCKLTQTGEYTIAARDLFGDNIGAYSLSLIVVPGPTVCDSSDLDGGNIQSGVKKLGKLSYKADLDGYTFSAAAGNGITVTMSRDSGALNPLIQLYAPDGSLEVSADSGIYGSYASIDSHVLKKTGLYTIVARDSFGDGAGNYSLTFIKIPSTQTSRFWTQDAVWFDLGELKAVAALRKNALNGANIVSIKNTATKALIKEIPCLDATFAARALTVVKDINGNGYPELAIVGIRENPPAVKVELRDTLTKGLIKTIFFANNFQPKEIMVRYNQAGRPELGVLGANSALGLARIEVRDVLTGVLVQTVDFTGEI